MDADEALENLQEAARVYAETLDAIWQDGDGILSGAVLVWEMSRVTSGGEPGHGPGYVLLQGTPLQALGALIYGRRMVEQELEYGYEDTDTEDDDG